MDRQIGYARASTDDLHGKAQKAVLHAVPCDLIFFGQNPAPTGSGRSRRCSEAAEAAKVIIRL